MRRKFVKCVICFAALFAVRSAVAATAIETTDEKDGQSAKESVEAGTTQLENKCHIDPELLMTSTEWETFVSDLYASLPDELVAGLTLDSCKLTIDVRPVCFTDSAVNEVSSESSEHSPPLDVEVKDESTLPDPIDACEAQGECELPTDDVSPSKLASTAEDAIADPPIDSESTKLAATETFVSADGPFTTLIDWWRNFPSIAERVAPRMVFRPFAIAPDQARFYSRGIYIYVPQGQNLEIFILNGENPPTPLVVARADGPFVRYPAPPAAEETQLLRVGASPMPQADSVPVLGPNPATRYRFAFAADARLTERSILLLRSGTLQAHLAVDPTMLAEWPPRSTGYSHIPIARAVPGTAWYRNSPLLADIVAHSAQQPPVINDPATVGHETAHLLNRWLTDRYAGYNRNNDRADRWPADAMYFGDGNGVLLKGIPGRFREVILLVPEALRGPRVPLYFTRPDRVNEAENRQRFHLTYILDEANAYMLEAEIGFQLHDSHYRPQLDQRGERIGVTEAAGEFISYALALLYYATEANSTERSVYEHEEWLNQLRFAVRLNVERAATAYKWGLDAMRFPAFQVGRRDYLTLLRTDATPRGNALRAFVIRTFGQAWFDSIVN